MPTVSGPAALCRVDLFDASSPLQATAGTGSPADRGAYDSRAFWPAREALRAGAVASRLCISPAAFARRLGPARDYGLKVRVTASVSPVGAVGRQLNAVSNEAAVGPGSRNRSGKLMGTFDICIYGSSCWRWPFRGDVVSAVLWLACREQGHPTYPGTHSFRGSCKTSFRPQVSTRNGYSCARNEAFQLHILSLVQRSRQDDEPYLRAQVRVEALTSFRNCGIPWSNVLEQEVSACIH